MTKEQINKYWDILCAIREGKTIQFKANLEEDREWQDVDNPAFYCCNKYRVKPEPEYVPFEPKDLHNLVGKLIKPKYGCEKEITFMVIGCDGNINSCRGVRTYNSWISPSILLENYIFTDGTPCGKIKEDK